MSNFYIENRSDLMCEKKKFKDYYLKNNSIKVYDYLKDNFFYKTILFNQLDTINSDLKTILKEQIILSLRQLNVNNNHTFIVGLGNDNHTADSVGCRCLKFIKSNAFLEELGVSLNRKVSALEPGTLIETGIDTKRIIESIVKDIKPDIIILIDSYVTNDFEHLNKCIQITNEGITPGSGLRGYQEEISLNTIGVPILVIGVPTAIEIKKSNCNYFLSTKNIDSYVRTISKIIGEAISEVLYYI